MSLSPLSFSLNPRLNGRSMSPRFGNPVTNWEASRLRSARNNTNSMNRTGTRVSNNSRRTPVRNNYNRPTPVNNNRSTIKMPDLKDENVKKIINSRDRTGTIIYRKKPSITPTRRPMSSVRNGTPVRRTMSPLRNGRMSSVRRTPVRNGTMSPVKRTSLRRPMSSVRNGRRTMSPRNGTMSPVRRQNFIPRINNQSINIMPPIGTISATRTNFP